MGVGEVFFFLTPICRSFYSWLLHTAVCTAIYVLAKSSCSSFTAICRVLLCLRFIWMFSSSRQIQSSPQLSFLKFTFQTRKLASWKCSDIALQSLYLLHFSFTFFFFFLYHSSPQVVNFDDLQSLLKSGRTFLTCFRVSWSSETSTGFCTSAQVCPKNNNNNSALTIEKCSFLMCFCRGGVLLLLFYLFSFWKSTKY